MPADASIYGMIRPQAPGPGPLDQYTQGLQVKHLIGQGQVNDLQVQKAQRDLQEDDAFKAAMRGADLKDPNTIGRLMGVSPQRALQLQKTLLEGDKQRADIANTRTTTQANQLKAIRDIAAQVNSDADLQGARQLAQQLVGPDMLAHLPFFNQPFTPENKQRALMGADEALKRLSPELRMQDIGGTITPVNPYTGAAAGAPITKTQTPESIASNATTIRGQNMTDARSREANEQGKTQVVTDAEGNITIVNKNTGVSQPATTANGAPLKAKPKALTDAQGRGQMFGTRAAESDKILTSLEDKISTTGLAAKQGLEGVPLVGGALSAAGNVALSDNQQKVEQAQRNFVNAVLRQESGAVISPSEFDNAKKQYFPQPGDSAAVREQKRQNRASAIEGFRVMSGPAGERIDAARKAPIPGQTAKGGIKFLGFEQ